MELKGFSTSVSSKSHAFQSHLYGIESPLVFGNVAIEVGFNRTFMELKVRFFMVNVMRSPGFNRTFMELKVTFRLTHLLRSYVSIAPLWN